MTRKMFREERLQKIYEKVKSTGKVYVTDLAEKFKVSDSSIRLDLAELENRGLIVRTYGGALLPESANNGVIENVSELTLRVQRMQKEKDAIGKLAATLVDDGDTIMIDGGSTTQYVARYLVTKRNLTIITNSISLLPDLLAIEDAVVYILGGLVYRKNSVLVGDIANENVNYFRPLKAILGMDGISLSSGLTAADTSVPAVATIKRKMINASDQFIVVADHTKINRTCLMPVAPLESMDYLVTDSGTPEDILEQIRKLGPVVKLAEA